MHSPIKYDTYLKLMYSPWTGLKFRISPIEPQASEITSFRPGWLVHKSSITRSLIISPTQFPNLRSQPRRSLPPLSTMEEYPEELRTPPVALVSLVGCSDLHASILTHLHTEQPPIHTLALPDFSKISLFAKAHKERTSMSAPPVGVLKKDWLLKHRTKIPAVVGALFSSAHISGDPAQWLQVCTELENLKYACLSVLSRLLNK